MTNNPASSDRIEVPLSGLDNRGDANPVPSVDC